MGVISLVTGDYKPTYNWGVPPCKLSKTAASYSAVSAFLVSWLIIPNNPNICGKVIIHKRIILVTNGWFMIIWGYLLWRAMYFCLFFAAGFGFFVGVPGYMCSCFSASLLLCFLLSALPLLRFSAFSVFPASLLFCFLLFCFSASLLFCFSAFLLLCFSDFLLLLCLSCFSASLLSLPLCFSAFYFSTFISSLLFASRLVCFLLFLFLCFCCFYCLSAFLLLILYIHCFSAFPASLLLCFFYFFCFFCFSAFCFPCFSASLLSLLLCFSAFVLLRLSTSTFSFLQSMFLPALPLCFCMFTPAAIFYSWHV